MINYITGDATKPQTPVKGPTRIIAHVCNDQGGWGSGFVIALSKRWSQPEAKYRQWSKQESFGLGHIQLVPVKDEFGRLHVAKMVAQHKYVSEDNPVAIRYEDLAICMLKLRDWIHALDKVKMGVDKDYVPFVSTTSIHMPRIGCGLAGGNWDIVSPLIEGILNQFDVYVYDLPKDKRAR